ncbi:uncharacterized protein LOC112686567 [Sipha flava]|uniref:Insulinoma-associated protein 2 n=1 Tax=Sipha flava TaxID=143950 RepID=A0A2S2QP76_9HEMI|nr:uncharacterized protein LOC112686567 [Sipha flava]
MTDYAQAAAAEPSWTWWMTNAAAAAMRMRNLRDHHAGSDAVDDEFVGPNRKRQRVGHVKGEYWTNAFGDVDDEHESGSPTNDLTAAGPLDLSVKATVAARIIDGLGGTGGRDEYKPCTTPVKKHTNSTTNGKSSKKASSKTTNGGGNPAAVRAATRKLLPQLDQRVDRSSPVSGTIIVPASPEDSKNVSSHQTTNATTDCGDGDRDDDYEGADIDPEFNVVVATDEARRRLESIPNALGPYRCRLCSVQYVDAFALARHRCRCIVHVRYRCPECDKVFQCPANLASHRRWHGTGSNAKTPGGNRNTKSFNDSGVKPEVAAVSDTDDAVANSNTTTTTTTTISTTCTAASASAITTAAGFKKNMLQRAAQAAAAAAVANNNNINNNTVIDNGNA